MESQIRIVGVLMILLTIMHVYFPKYFRWKTELQKINLINRQMLLVHTFFIALMLLMLGILLISSPAEIVNTRLGRQISLGLGIFWLIRLYVQFFGYSRELWRGKLFETAIHIIFSILWAYFSIIFFANYFR